MPNTTDNFNIPFLDGTELVRDYPTFSESLAEAIDAGLSGAAGVLQVVSTTKNDTFTTTSGTHVDITGFSLSITPSSTTSKVLLFVTVGAVDNLSTVAANTIQVLRDSTAVGVASSSAANGAFHVNPGADRASSIAWSFYDSPNTVSAITYKVQAKTTGGTFLLNRNVPNSQFAVSTITALEVAS